MPELCTDPHGPHGIDRGPWGTWHCPGVPAPVDEQPVDDVELTGPADSALGRATVAIATALDGDGGIDAGWLAKVVIDALVDWSAGEPSPDAALVDAALAWSDSRRAALAGSRRWVRPVDLELITVDRALIAAVDAWRAEEDDLAGEVDDEPTPAEGCRCCRGRGSHLCGDQCVASGRCSSPAAAGLDLAEATEARAILAAGLEARGIEVPHLAGPRALAEIALACLDADDQATAALRADLAEARGLQDAITVTRHRAVMPHGTLKGIDRATAVALVARHGGHVDRSTVRLLPDGTEILGPWTPILDDPPDRP